MTVSGDGSSINQRRWRIVLPILNLVVAVSLLVVGHYQQQNVSPERTAATATGGEWTPASKAPLAPGTQVAYAINFPAVLVASPLQAVNRNAVIAGFLCALLIVWYIVGLVVDSGIPRPSHKLMAIAAASLIGVLGAIAGVWFAWRAVGTHYLVPPLGALVWSGAFGVYCISVLRRAVLAHS